MNQTERATQMGGPFLMLLRLEASAADDFQWTLIGTRLAVAASGSVVDNIPISARCEGVAIVAIAIPTYGGS